MNPNQYAGHRGFFPQVSGILGSSGILSSANNGKQLGLVGTWYSGQCKRTMPGIDGVFLLVVIGDGKLITTTDHLTSLLAKVLL
jgi:hypothetical protein